MGDLRISILALPVVDGVRAADLLVPPSVVRAEATTSSGEVSRAKRESMQFAALEQMLRSARPEDEMSVVSALSALGGATEDAEEDLAWLNATLHRVAEGGVVLPAKRSDTRSELDDIHAIDAA